MTPEPWSIDTVQPDKHGIRIVDVQDCTIATVWRNPLDPPEWAEDNARLIVNAKKLFAAAVAALDFFNETRAGQEWEQQGGTEPEQLREVIAAIEGRGP